MKKLKPLISSPCFWIRFAVISLLTVIFELFLLGYWALPYINYRVPFMNEITGLDLAFVAVFALLFGFGVTIFLLARKFSVAGCAIGTGSGLLGAFTLLCPVCPVFFLVYFGLSTTVLTLSPYFWAFRLISLALLLVGIFLLWRSQQIRKLPTFDVHRTIQIASVVAIVVLLFANQAIAFQMGNEMVGSDNSDGVVLSGDFARDIAAMVTPASLPFYGPELGLDFSSLNAINASIKKMSVMAPKQGSNPIELTDEQMERYITIGTESTITCEFCCSVKTLVREDGSPSCGCAHSIAMRGMAAYLIVNYPELTNADISYEIVRQKGLYFPKQMQKRMAQGLSGEFEEMTPDIKYLLKNFSDEEITDLQIKAKDSGFEPDASIDMVGGC